MLKPPPQNEVASPQTPSVPTDLSFGRDRRVGRNGRQGRCGCPCRAAVADDGAQGEGLPGRQRVVADRRQFNPALRMPVRPKKDAPDPLPAVRPPPEPTTTTTARRKQPAKDASSTRGIRFTRRLGVNRPIVFGGAARGTGTNVPAHRPAPSPRPLGLLRSTWH